MKAFLVVLSMFFIGLVNAQTDTTSQSGNYFLTFVKKVYLNPTVYLRCQQFKETTNIGFVALPDLSSSQNNASSGFEKGLQKLIRLLMQTDGGIRFYFNPDTPTAPFTFWSTDNLWCKFQQPEKDSINYYLNHNFSDGNLDLNNNQRFENTIDETLDYIQRVLAANTASCGDQPQNETTTINTKPLSITLHNRANSKYDIDIKQYQKLESVYAKAFDEHTQEDWYAPAKLLVPNENDESVALAIHANESFRKQNVRIEVLKTHEVLGVDPTSTADSIFFKIPKTFPLSDPVEVVVKYKSTVDSITYTVGFFMVYVMERKTQNLVLIPANGFVITNQFRDSVANELTKIYGHASVNFNVSVSNSIVFPNEYPTTIDMEGSGLLSNYPVDLRDYVGDVKYDDDYDPDNYYLVIGLSAPGLQGYMPRARNIGFIFSNGVNKSKVIAHEIGHGVFHFRHIFDDEELGATSQGTTNNIMDYVANPTSLYLHQWNFIKDPAFVSFSNGDDDDAAMTTCNMQLLEPFKTNHRFNFIKNNGKYISLPETIKSVSFSTMDRYVYSQTGFQSDYVAPVGALLIFTDANGRSFRNMGDGFFYDENNVKYQEDLSNYDSIKAAITCFIDVDISTGDIVPVFFQAPSDFNVASNSNPMGVDTDQSLVIFKNDLDLFVQSPLSYMTYARAGLNSGNANFIQGNSIYFSSDSIPFKFYRANEIVLNGVTQLPMEVSFKDFKIEHLFPKMGPTITYTNEEILRYLTIKSIRKSELTGIAHCIESETYEDAKISLAILEQLTLPCTSCTKEKDKIRELRSRTVFTMINQSLNESSNVASTLEQMILDNKNEDDFGEYISNIEVCDMYGIPWETRSKVLDKIIYDDENWSVDGKSILAMLIKSSVDDDGTKLLDFFKANNFARLNSLIVQIDEWTDVTDAADVKDGMSAMEQLIRHVIVNKASYPQSTNYFTFSATPYSTVTVGNSNGVVPSTVLNFPEKPYEFNFPVVEIPMVLGAAPNMKVDLPNMSFGNSYYGSIGGYELATKANQTKYPITWDQASGTFKVTQNFTVTEKLVGPVFCVPGTQFPDIEVYTVNLNYTLQPYDLIDVVIGDNYGALDLPKGTVLQLPVITAYFLQESIRNENFSRNFRLVFNVVEIGLAVVAIVTAPITLGNSLVIFAGVMASIDAGIQAKRNELGTAQEYYSNYYKTWDNIKMISDLALGATAAYQLGKYVLKQGRSFVLAIAIRRAIKNTKLPTDFLAMPIESQNLTKRIITAVQKGVNLENTYILGSGANDAWLLWSQYPKIVLNGEELAVVGSRFFTRTAVERMVPSGLGGSGIPPSAVGSVLTTGENLVIGVQKRYNLGNVFVWTDNTGNIIRDIRVNKVNSISDLASNPESIFGYLDTDLESLLNQSGWTKGTYNGTSDAVMYYKQSNAGRSEIVFNYGGGLHSGGQTFNKPYYYKLEGPEFGRKIRVIDKETYPASEFQNAMQFETFKLVDGPTGVIWKP